MGNVLIEHNYVWNNETVQIYWDWVSDCVTQYNVLFMTDDYVEHGNGTPGFTMRDETTKSQSNHDRGLGYGPTKNSVFTNNLLVNLNPCIQIGRVANLEDCVIANNTIVTRRGYAFQMFPHNPSAGSGRVISNTEFVNNIVYGTISTPTDNYNIDCSHNVWKVQPKPAFSGTGDRVGDPKLISPNKTVTRYISPSDYKLSDGSICINGGVAI